MSKHFKDFDFDFDGDDAETRRAEALPDSVTFSMAAFLLHLSRRTIREMVRQEELTITWGGHGFKQPRIPLLDIAVIRGGPIDLKTYREAQARLAEHNRSRRDDRHEKYMRANHGAAA